MPKSDVLLVIDSEKSARSSVGNFVLSSGGGGGGGGGSTDLASYLRRDGTSAMMGNLDMGGFSVQNVALLDGIDLPAHVGNQDAHHARVHTLAGADHTGQLPWDRLDFTNSELVDVQVRPHYALTNITPDDHHNQVHNILGADHTVVGAAFDLIGLTATNTLGLHTPSFNPGATSKILRSDTSGALIIKRLEGTDFVKSSAYLQAATYVQAGSYVSAVTYVDSPILQQAGNISVNSGINIYLNPTGFVSVGVSSGRAIRTPSFVSGFLGDGWQIDQGITAPGTNAEFDNLTIRGRMRVYELLIQRIRATNGSIFVSSVGKAATVTLVSGDTYTITTDDDHGFLENDLIRAQQFTGNVPNPLYRCDMRVTVINTLKSFRAIRENASDLPKIGMDFVRIGNTTDSTRRGGLYLSSDDSNAPFMDVFDGVSSWAAWTNTGKVKTRIGKISGVTSVANEYGFIAGNAGFGPTNSWVKVSSLGIVLNNVPLQFFNGVNQTGYWSNTGTSFWLGTNTTDRHIDWNGSVLTIKGQITVVAGGNAATTTDVSNNYTYATDYTNNYAPNKALSNTTANWAGSNARGGSANDTLNVNGVASSTVQGYAQRAGFGLDTNGRIVRSVVGPAITDNSVSHGLNMTSTYIGFWNATIGNWTMFMKADGTFRFGHEGAVNRIEWNGTELAGYNTANQRQWWISSSDGHIYAAAGYVIINNQGVTAGTWTLLNGNGLTVIRPVIAYTNTAEPVGILGYAIYPSPSNAIDLNDTAFSAGDWYGNSLYYPGQAILRIYSSSKHLVSDDTPTDSDIWYHYLDGVIELPPQYKPARTLVPPWRPPPYGAMGQNVSDQYIPRLFLRNLVTSIILHEWQRVDINAENTYFKNLTNSYENPVELASARIWVGTSTQGFYTSSNMVIQQGANNSIQLGNASNVGEIAAYGYLTTRQWFRIIAHYDNGGYMEWFARIGGARSAWMGFGDASTTSLSIVNEMGSQIYLQASNRVLISNHIAVQGVLQLIRQSVTPTAMANTVQVYAGGDGHIYFRGPNGYARVTGYTVLSGSYP